MTEECRPADGAEDGSLHWVRNANQGYRVWLWQAYGSVAGVWRMTASDLAWHPLRAAGEGWLYTGPALPPVAETAPGAGDDAADARRFRRLLSRWIQAYDAIDPVALRINSKEVPTGGIRALIDADIARSEESAP